MKQWENGPSKEPFKPLKKPLDDSLCGALAVEEYELKRRMFEMNTAAFVQGMKDEQKEMEQEGAEMSQSARLAMEETMSEMGVMGQMGERDGWVFGREAGSEDGGLRWIKGDKEHIAPSLQIQRPHLCLPTFHTPP